MLRSSAAPLWTMGWVVGALLLGCTNPFVTRDPETPSAGASTWIPPRRAEIVLQNLRNAILERNVENYLRCLSDSSRALPAFRFVADPLVASENPGTFETWSIENERRYFSQLRSLVPADSLQFLSLTPVQNTQYGDSALLVQNYSLIVRHTQQRQGVPGEVAGQARFFMQVDRFGDWAIYRWEDRSLGEKPTWSVLKAIYGK